MDERLFDLKNNPAKDVFGKTGNYPLRWGEMQAEIFQKLLIEYDESKISNMLKHGRDYSIKNYR